MDSELSVAYPHYSPLFPNPITCLRDMLGTAAGELRTRLVAWEGGVWSWLWDCVRLTAETSRYADWSVWLLPVSIAVAFIFTRIALDNLVLKVVICHACKLSCLHDVNFVCHACLHVSFIIALTY